MCLRCVMCAYFGILKDVTRTFFQIYHNFRKIFYTLGVKNVITSAGDVFATNLTSAPLKIIFFLLLLVGCSFHAHVQHLMHLRQSDLHVFSTSDSF